MLHDLKTSRGENHTGAPWAVYPRPQMRRDSYWNLNGVWEFSVGQEKQTMAITVPFCPESQLSGIQKHYAEGSSLNYRRRFTLPEGFRRGRILLHIGGADQFLEGFVNGILVGSHTGGYTNITFDITAAVKDGENLLELFCIDDLRDQNQPYGKQVMPEKRGGMWYTPVSGIWQTVWLESVPQTYIHHLEITNRGASVTIDTGLKLPGTVTVAGLGTFPLKEGKATITPEKPHFWSPEDPYLYEAEIEVGEDRVETYFALRTLEIKEIGGYRRLCLNGKPYFFHGLLDQGYWPDGLLTPPGPECFADDILAMKKLGFNTLRKHIKVEPEEFYYQCDKLGMVVFQDMVNNGAYRFGRDTALPTVLRSAQKLPTAFLGSRKNEAAFLNSMEATVRQLKNHPSILYWTIFNEGWGQCDSDKAYDLLRDIDDTRWIDAASGWFRQKKTDVDSRHVYFRKVALKAERKPLVLSEFGGYSCKVEGHVFNAEKAYGYGSYSTLGDLEGAVAALYREQVLPQIKKGLCAAIYTQVSDVEDEINGLLTYDRKVEKLRPETMLPIARMLQEAIEE